MREQRRGGLVAAILCWALANVRLLVWLTSELTASLVYRLFPDEFRRRLEVPLEYVQIAGFLGRR